MEKINEIKLPEGVDRIVVKQYDDKIVIEFIPEEAKFKRGDILVYEYPESDETGIVILDRTESNKLYFTAILNRGGRLFFNNFIADDFKIIGFANNEHKTKLFDELEKNGKRWNAEAMKIEDILKKGDLAIFWDNDKTRALIRIYDEKGDEYHYDNSITAWRDAIKFESKEQFEKVLRGEI